MYSKIVFDIIGKNLMVILMGFFKILYKTVALKFVKNVSHETLIFQKIAAWFARDCNIGRKIKYFWTVAGLKNDL